MVAPRQAPESLEARWSPLERGLGILLALFFGGAIVWVAHPWYDEVNDAALYVLTGHALGTGAGYSYLGEPFVVRPPGFSALLAPFLTGDAADFALLNTIVAAFGALGAWLVYALFRPRLGGLLAAALALLVWVNPTWQRVSSQVLSDVPGATLCLLALVVAERAQRRPTWSRHVVLGSVLAVAVYLRTMNALLIPALLLGRLLGRDARPGERAWSPLALALALPIFAYAPWIARNANVATEQPPEQLLLHSYSTAMWHVDPGDPSSARLSLVELATRSQHQLEQTLIVLGRRMHEAGDLGLAQVVAIALLALVALELWRRRSAVEFVTAAFAAVLVAYFVLRTRLVLPLWLLVLPLAAQALVGMLESFVHSTATRARVRGFLAFAVLVLAGFDAGPRDWLAEVEATDAERRAAVATLRREVPPGAAAVAVRGWHWGVHALDRSIWSLQYLAKRSGPLDAWTTLAQRAGARVTALDVTTPVGAALHKALGASGPPLARQGRFVLYRLDP